MERCAALGLTALGLFSGASDPTQGQVVRRVSEWKLAEFQNFLDGPAPIKQLYDIVQIGDGKFLNNLRILSMVRFGFGIPERHAAALHGPANLLNYDDYIWEKYQIGEWLKVTGPTTGKPPRKNLFYNSKIGLKKRLLRKIQTIWIPSVRIRACKPCKRGARSF